MNKILEFKHWQLFFLIFVLPIFLIKVSLTSFISGEEITGINDFGSIHAMWLPAFSLMLAVLLYCFWMWRIVKKGNQVVMPNLRLNLLTFNFFIALRASFIIFLLIVFSSFSIDYNLDIDIPSTWNLSILLGLILWKILSFCGWFYCASFSAKIIKKIELNSPVGLDQCLGLFFGFLFFPVGVWFIQPKVNKFMIREDEIKEEHFV